MSERAWIFANGDLPDPSALRALIAPGDRLIAADGGLRHLRRLGLTPHVLVGDLDSVDPADLPALRTAGVQVERFPREKDETDLELAVFSALRAGCRWLRIAAALGGRLDQTLGNLFLLALPALAEVDARLEDGREEVFLIRGRAEIHGRAGDIVSLLALGGEARGVTTTALRYPLRGETLYLERTRGISNVMLGDTAAVELEGGSLICIHTRISIDV